MKNIKILIATLLFLLLFAISCSNEDKTGGGTENYDSNTKTNNYVPNPNPDPTPTPPPAIRGQLTASATKYINIKIANQKMHSAGSLYFSVRPYELEKAGNFTVSIDSVAKATGNSSSLELTPTDFDSLTPSSKELTLLTKGLTKVNSASDLSDATYYNYDITFKFTTTSDTVSNKTATAKSTVHLYKYKVVTAQMLEDMIKTTPKLTVTNFNASGFGSGSVDPFDIDFSKITYIGGLRDISVDKNNAMTGPKKENSIFSEVLFKKDIAKLGTDENSKFPWLSRSYLVETKVSADKKVLIATYKFQLNEGYIWDNNMTFATEQGLNIHFTLDKGEWNY